MLIISLLLGGVLLIFTSIIGFAYTFKQPSTPKLDVLIGALFSIGAISLSVAHLILLAKSLNITQ